MKRFEGKTALVTGGNSGIGLATALAFAREGARVVITGRDPSTLDQAKAQLGADALAIRNDASHIAEAAALAETLEPAGIRLDAVFINAGVARLGRPGGGRRTPVGRLLQHQREGPVFSAQGA